jgi:transposase
MDVRSMQVEVLEDAGRRRRWSADEKARIVEESLQPRASVTVVARRHQVSKSLVYEWRRLARSGELGVEPAAAFVPVEVGPPTSADTALVQDARRSLPPSRRRAGLIEIELAGGRRVRVDAQFDAEALRRVLDVLEQR